MATILCFIDETALHAPQGGRRIPRHTGGDYTVFYRRNCTSRTSGRPQDSPSCRCRVYCVLSTKLHFTHFREAAGFSVMQVPNILCFITETAFHALQGGCRMLRHAAAEYIMFYSIICTSRTSGRPQESTWVEVPNILSFTA